METLNQLKNLNPTLALCLEDMDAYQAWTNETAVYPIFTHYAILNLAGEAGEVAGVLAKYERGDFDVNELNRRLFKELGDVLYMLARVCEDRGFKLSEVANANIAKLTKRMEDGTIKGDGNDR